MRHLNRKDPAVEYLLSELEHLDKERLRLQIQINKIRKRLDALKRPIQSSNAGCMENLSRRAIVESVAVSVLAKERGVTPSSIRIWIINHIQSTRPRYQNIRTFSDMCRFPEILFPDAYRIDEQFKLLRYHPTATNTTHPMKRTTTLALLSILAITALHADPLEDVGIATIISGQKGGPAMINDNGRNAFVVGDGQGNGVIFQDKGPTYIQKVGGTTFIVPTGNQGRRNDCNQER